MARLHQADRKATVTQITHSLQQSIQKIRKLKLQFAATLENRRLEQYRTPGLLSLDFLQHLVGSECAIKT